MRSIIAATLVAGASAQLGFMNFGGSSSTNGMANYYADPLGLFAATVKASDAPNFYNDASPNNLHTLMQMGMFNRDMFSRQGTFGDMGPLMMQSVFKQRDSEENEDFFKSMMVLSGANPLSTGKRNKRPMKMGFEHEPYMMEQIFRHSNAAYACVSEPGAATAGTIGNLDLTLDEQGRREECLDKENVLWTNADVNNKPFGVTTNQYNGGNRYAVERDDANGIDGVGIWGTTDFNWGVIRPEYDNRGLSIPWWTINAMNGGNFGGYMGGAGFVGR